MYSGTTFTPNIDVFSCVDFCGPVLKPEDRRKRLKNGLKN
jgi:hypothetical protein